MKNKNLKLDCAISENTIHYLDPKWQDKFKEFKQNNEGERIEINFIIKSGVEYYQHKFYHGFLLPDIAFAMGEKDLSFLHILLKRDFLYQDCTGVDDIPKKHCKNGIYPISEEQLFNLNPDMNIPFSMIKGCVICYNEAGEVIGYIPSNANITYEEKKAFHEKIEHRLFVDLAGRLGEEGRGQGAADRARDLSKGQE